MVFVGDRGEVVAGRALHDSQAITQLLADLEDDLVDLPANEDLRLVAPSLEAVYVALARKGDFGAARSLVNEAIRLLPRESRFHGLLGELAMAAKDPREALGHFEKARQLDPGYFKPIVQAGMGDAAGRDLAAAVSSAGGLGTIGTIGRSVEQTQEEIAATGAMTSSAPATSSTGTRTSASRTGRPARRSSSCARSFDRITWW